MQRQRSVSMVRQRLMSITDCPVTTLTVTACDGPDSTDVRYPPNLDGYPLNADHEDGRPVPGVLRSKAPE